MTMISNVTLPQVLPTVSSAMFMNNYPMNNYI
jgi:hypothetical protein